MAHCAYTKIAVMQLFYELKQKFPTIPDQVVSDLMQQAAYNKEECEKRLSEEYRRYQVHSYPSDIVNKMTEGKERPKTLSLSTNDANATNAFRRADKALRVEEERRRRLIPNGPKSSNDVSKVRSSQKTDDVGLRAKGYGPHVNGDGRPPDDVDVHRDVDVDVESVQNFEISSSQPDVYVSDLKLQFQNDSCCPGQSNLRIKYQRDSHSAPTTPSSSSSLSLSSSSPYSSSSSSSSRRSAGCDSSGGVAVAGAVANAAARKHRSSLNVDRLMKSPVTGDGARPRTGVKMTMRPPSSVPQQPISITSTAGGGSNLVYMTTSCGAATGYQNQLQISINEDGNTTISASRTRNTSSSIPSHTSNDVGETVDDSGPDLLAAFDSLSTTCELRLREQVERKQRLEAELEREKEALAQKKLEVKAMEEDLERRRKAPFISEKVIVLRAEVAALSDECRRMEEFLSRARQRPPTVPFNPINNDAGPDETGNWTCRMCTFKNHPMLPKCEQCEMVRVDLSNALNNIFRPRTAPAIHPRV